MKLFEVPAASGQDALSTLTAWTDERGRRAVLAGDADMIRQARRDGAVPEDWRTLGSPSQYQEIFLLAAPDVPEGNLLTLRMRGTLLLEDGDEPWQDLDEAGLDLFCSDSGGIVMRL